MPTLTLIPVNIAGIYSSSVFLIKIIKIVEFAVFLLPLLPHS